MFLTARPGRPLGGCLAARFASVLAAAAALAGCAASASGPAWPAAGSESHLRAADERRIDTCTDALDAPRHAAVGALDAARIDLVNWNIKKKSIPTWREDYSRLTRGTELILIQEAALRADTIVALPAVPHWSFAPGYRADGAVTGVLTLSSVEPLTRCSFVTTEPVLRTPKATSITQFRLAGRPDTLLVINVHAVNFSFGLGAYKRQFEQIAGVLEDHEGPVILSGDLNTWRAGRMHAVDALAAAYGLEALAFGDALADDHRSRFFGRPLDHIYVRGLEPVSAHISDVSSSDHNPLSVTFAL